MNTFRKMTAAVVLLILLAVTWDRVASLESIPWGINSSICKPVEQGKGAVGFKCIYRRTVREALLSLSEGSWAVEEIVEQVRRIANENRYKAVFFETPMVVLDNRFEFAILDASGTHLDSRPPSNDFNSYCIDKMVTTFPTYNKDAQLIVPCEHSDTKCYPHLLRLIGTNASCVLDEQVMDFWKTVGFEALKKTTTSKHLWMSTSGLGVSWLHFRLDTSPKYYTYEPYKAIL